MQLLSLGFSSGLQNASPLPRRDRAVFKFSCLNDLLHPPGEAGRVGKRAFSEFSGEGRPRIVGRESALSPLPEPRFAGSTLPKLRLGRVEDRKRPKTNDLKTARPRSGGGRRLSGGRGSFRASQWTCWQTAYPLPGLKARPLPEGIGVYTSCRA